MMPSSVRRKGVARPSRPHPTASDGLAVGPKGAFCLALTAKPKRLELARLVWPCHPRPFSAC